MNNLKDHGVERAILSCILHNGKDAFVDSEGIISASDFSLGINRVVYSAFKELSEDPKCEVFDLESLKLKIKAIGHGKVFEDTKESEYIELLDDANFEKSNIEMFAFQIKKYSVLRDLYTRYKDASKYLEQVSGNETLSEIVGRTEGYVTDYLNGIESTNTLTDISSVIEEYVEKSLNEKEVKTAGLSSGFPIWDKAIGGIRKSGITTVVARSKVGKSFFALNVAANIASQNIKTLYLDTELVLKPQLNRLIPIVSECPIHLYETRQFKHSKDLVEDVKAAAQTIKGWPLFYENIGGKNHTEALSIVKRWITRHVGFNEYGKANDCFVIYDYMKLTGDQKLSQWNTEWIALGAMITMLHDFCLKYDIPMLGMVQANRDGIENESDDIVAGSDRILWLSTSLSLLKNKTDQDADLGCGFEFGNKKLRPLASRYGCGLYNEADYINIRASIYPKVNEEVACGRFIEGYKYSDIAGKR